MPNKVKILLIVILSALSVPRLSARLYAVCVGINHYSAPQAPSLRYAQTDARNFAQFLKQTSPGASITLITGANATRSNILHALVQASSQASPNDIVMFYFSGHGYTGGMIASDTRTTESLLTYRDISNILKKSKVRNKVIFADTCFAGTGRLTKSHSSGNTNLNDQNILLFLSSRSNEKSTERMYTRGGLFTTFLLNGMSGKADSNGDNKITARELFNYVNTGVARESRGKQHPVMWGKFNPDMVLMTFTR